MNRNWRPSRRNRHGRPGQSGRVTRRPGARLALYEAFYGEFDPESRILRYVNAGHHPPLVVRQNGGRVSILRLKSDGVPVGVSPDAQYEEMSFFLLQPGDFFVASVETHLVAESPY
jgi:hypothetical protein